MQVFTSKYTANELVGGNMQELRDYLMASPEKTLCDELYRISGIRSINAIEALLFQDLRLDPDEFIRLDRKALLHFAACYHAATLNTFAKFLGRDLHA